MVADNGCMRIKREPCFACEKEEGLYNTGTDVLCHRHQLSYGEYLDDLRSSQNQYRKARRMKAQNCPLCGSVSRVSKYGSHPEGTKYVSCSDEDCQMWIVSMILPELWNRLRIAPDDKPVSSIFVGDIEIAQEGWMNPNWPEGGANGFQKGLDELSEGLCK